MRRTGRLLAFGGCYSNLQATQALLAQARSLGIPTENMVCTGDVVAYGADAAATLQLVRDAGILSIAGNCEEALAVRAADCGCGFAPGSACDALAGEWYAHALREVDDEARRYMAGLPKQLRIELDGKIIRVLHGNAERINAFVFPSASNMELARQLDIAAADAVVAGHSGIPFTRHLANGIWHNPGAIGMPAHDGTTNGWFSVIEVKDGQIVIAPQILAYDFAAAAAAMRRAGLPEGYAQALETGYWPSEDSLPMADRARRQNTTGPVPEVALERLQTLWVNTGTLCNLTCANCFMESSPANDSLSYFTLANFRALLAEAPQELREIGFTGGEPFTNPDIMPMLEDALAAGKTVLVLTNAMRPMQRHDAALARLITAYPARLTIRVSLDHYLRDRHEALRGEGSFAPTMAGLRFLNAAGANTAVASRTPWGETEAMMRDGFATLFRQEEIALDASDAGKLVLFPEMDTGSSAPSVTHAALDAMAPETPLMCVNSRMAVQRKGRDGFTFTPCTLLPDRDLSAMGQPVPLDHPYCSQFCVYGGGACSG